MNILIRNLDIVVLIILLFLYLAFSTSLFLLEPRIWPDEAYIADIANNIATKGVAGTDLWGDTIVGVRKSFYWYPSIYTNTLAGWFILLGFSVANQRLLSVILGLIFILVLYFFIQNIFDEISEFKRKVLALLSIFFLIIDNTFLKSSRLGRPEMLVFLFGFISMFFFTKKTKYKKISYFLTGLFSGFAFLTHFLGGFFIILLLINHIFSYRTKIIKTKIVFFFIVGFVLPVSVWLISLYPNYPILFKQLLLQSSFRTLVPSHILAVFQTYPIQQKIIYSTYALLSIVIIFIFLKKRLFNNLLLFTGLIFGWLICLQGKLEWYSVYIIVFLYPLALFIVFKNSFKKLSNLTAVLLATLFVFNFYTWINSFNLYRKDKDDYYIFGQEVKKRIEENKTIYLSTTPDLYFIFKGRNTFYEFPGIKPKVKEYIDLLNASDYIVINFHLEHLFVGNLLDKYIELNKQKVFQVNTNLYQAEIIELLPKDMRQSPL